MSAQRKVQIVEPPSTPSTMLPAASREATSSSRTEATNNDDDDAVLAAAARRTLAIDVSDAVAVVAQTTPVAQRREARISFAPDVEMTPAATPRGDATPARGDATPVRSALRADGTPIRSALRAGATPVSERRVSFGPGVESPKASRERNHKQARISPAVKAKLEHGPLQQNHWLNQSPREKNARPSRRAASRAKDA